MYDLHGTELNIFHRKLIAGVTGFLTGGPVGAITGLATGGGKPRPKIDVGCPPPQYMRDAADNCVVVGAVSPFQPQRPSVCIPPWFPKPGGGCELDLIPGPGGGGTGPVGRDQGEAIMGRYGAAMVPTLIDRTIRDCLPGMVLGKDLNCYNARDISNKERRWPKGRAPLLTGGERNAISKARRAAGKLERTTKALQDMGMLRKPAPRTKTRTVTKMLGAGSPSIINVE